MGSHNSKQINEDNESAQPPSPPQGAANETADSQAHPNDEVYRGLKSLFSANSIVTKSDEDLVRQTRPDRNNASSSTFSTSSLYLNALTTGRKTVSDQNLAGGTEKMETEPKSTKSTTSQARFEWLPMPPSRVYRRKGDNYLRKLDHGQISCRLDESLFASNLAYFSSHFSKEDSAKSNAESEVDEISFNQTLVQDFLARSREISSRRNKLCQVSKSKLQPSINSRRKVTQSEAGEKIKASKSGSSHNKPAKSAGRTYSRLSVDSEKTIYHYQKAQKSPQLNKKKASIISNESLSFKREKAVRSPTVTTPAEVMVRGYIFYRRVASGSFSNLFECSCFSMPNLELACKHIRSSEFVAKKAILKNFLEEEVEILQRVNHPNVITMYEIVSTPTDVYIFMKFATNGTIFDYLYKEWRKPLPETYARRWMKHLVAGLEYVHGLKIVHRDLKLENFLLDEKYTGLLSDFGLAVQLASANASRLLSVHCGTQDYMAPELNMAAASSNSIYDPFPADIYAMGVCMFEMLNYYRPFAISLSESPRSLVYRQQHRKYQLNKRIFLEKDCDELLNLLLEPKPSLRPTASVVLAHAWFQNSKH